MRALETVGNIMRRHGLDIQDRTASFTLAYRLDLKALIENGILWSYRIGRVRREEDVIDKG